MTVSVRTKVLGALLASTLAAVATYKTSNEGIKDIQEHEGIVYKAYLDVAGIPTIIITINKSETIVLFFYLF